MVLDVADVLHVLVAMLGGLAVGLERQWSGKATGPRAHFAGLRTFTLLGAMAGLSGWLWLHDGRGLAIVLLSAAASIIAIGYLRASRTDVDGTTEVSAIVVLAAGVMAGMGLINIAMGMIALTVLLLIEKSRLHAWVSRLDDEGIEAGARFAVMGLVVLPLLPAGAYGPYGAIKPREIWALVLFFSGLSFVSYVIRRLIKSEQSYTITGVLGGFISSTAVTLTMSRLSRDHQGSEVSMASGVMGANAMMVARVVLTASVLAPALPVPLAATLAAPFAVAAILTLWSMLRPGRGQASKAAAPENPLQFGAALQMAVVFQVVLIGFAFARAMFGAAGVYVSAGILGLTDVDALTLSMAKSAQQGTEIPTVITAIAIGVLVNTLVKLGIVLAIGRHGYRVRAGVGLALMAVALGVGLFIRL